MCHTFFLKEFQFQMYFVISKIETPKKVFWYRWKEEYYVQKLEVFSFCIFFSVERVILDKFETFTWLI